MARSQRISFNIVQRKVPQWQAPIILRYKDVCKRDMKALGILTAVNGEHWLQNIQLGGRQCSFRPFQVSKDTLPNRLKQKDN